MFHSNTRHPINHVYDVMKINQAYLYATERPGYDAVTAVDLGNDIEFAITDDKVDVQ